MQPKTMGPVVVAVLILTAAPLAGNTDKPKTVLVDCTKDQSIQKALEDKAEELIVEIHGICQENVKVNRDKVSLRGRDPALDGIQGTEDGRANGLSVIEVLRAKNVTIENIQASQGGFSGLEINQSVDVTIANCRSFDNLGHGLAVHGSLFLDASDLTISDNSRRGISVFQSVNVLCTRCQVDAGDDFGVLAVEGATVIVRVSSVSGTPALYALNASFIEAFDSAMTSPSRSIQAWAHAQIFFTRGTLSGPVVALNNSTVQLFETHQIANAPGFNFVDLDSVLALEQNSSLIGHLVVEDFSKAVVEGASTVGGDLTCSSGGDVFCEDPGTISGAVSGCVSCTPTVP